ncbi:phospholipid scramblase-related protein [Spirillospora sp. NPDC048823]|uniref:phospholipid scramblase-related protein n=1 Tax=unclassified Spirillospora TaxID=2642701 RepID=UPI003720D1EF
MSDLFSSPVLRVDQPRGVPGAESRYRVFDGNGTLLATAGERDISRLRRAARTAGGGGGSGRTVHVESTQGVPLISVQAQKGTGSGDTHVSTADGALIGSLRKIGEKAGYQYMLLDAAERPVGRLDGSRYGYKFRVIDGYGNHVAQVDKKLKGVATELLTTADRYSVEIFQPLHDPLRVLVVATPIAIDLMLYEGKDWPIG